MSNQRPIGFLEYIAHGGSIENRGTGVRCHYLPSGQGDFIPVDFSYEELGRIDSRLPVVLRTVFDKVSHPTIPLQTIFTTWLSVTLQHWYNPVQLTDYNAVTHNLAEIINIDRMDHQYEVARVAASCYNVEYIEDIPYAMHTNVMFLTLGYAELNKKFQGWRARYDALLALDATPGELAAQVFPKASITINPDISWNNVTFS